MRSDRRLDTVKARDRIIDVITDSARQMSNDDLCLLLVYVFALTDHAADTNEGSQPET